MRFLTYEGLFPGDLAPQLERVRSAIERGELAAIDLKKLGVGGYYRAKLSERARLVLQFVQWEGQRAALALEILPNHEYEKSRFLRGARIDESRIEDAHRVEVLEAAPIKYLHPTRASFALLDKPLSFDDVQDDVLRRRPPLVLVGSAGSGKTALLLQQLRGAAGRVAYVTESAWLAQSARGLYVAHGWDPGEQEADFLSYRQFLESIAVPSGRAVTFRDFIGFFERHRQKVRFTDAHRCFEEFRGVITADAGGLLSREAYLGLGVRLSLFEPAQREQLYELLQRYLEWMTGQGLFEPNLIAGQWAARATPRYDFIAVDEVQDLTPVQLQLVLKTLSAPGAFIVAGDAHQVVHPNFFSWAKVKTLFWQGLGLAGDRDVAVLAVSYRNAPEVTKTANALLALKNARFGSIDRESTTLLEPVKGEPGEVRGISTSSKAVAELDAQTRRSTEVAVIVLREEDKAEARAHFGTPLLFSVLESKGLEYENVILYRLVSSERKLFGELAEGVTAEELRVDSLEYARAHDKADRSSEAYKFFINALYVALTRAVKNVWLVEDDPSHSFLSLLGVPFDGQALAAGVRQASVEDWQREAHRLEAHGKLEQLEAIRSSMLRVMPTPWRAFDGAAMTELLGKALEPAGVSRKAREQLCDAIVFHPDPFAARELHDLNFRELRVQREMRDPSMRRLLEGFESKKFKGVLENTEKYGLEYRSMYNLTPLMMAAFAGNLELAQALVTRGASREARDHLGLQPLHWALRRASRDPAFSQSSLGAMWDLLAPASFDVRIEGRLVQIGREQGEYFVFHALLELLFRAPVIMAPPPRLAGLATADLLTGIESLPEIVVRDYRKKRPYLSSMLSKNEVLAPGGRSRQLFERRGHGVYTFNPALAVRVEDPGGEGRWVQLNELLNEPLRLRSALMHDSRRLLQRRALDW